MQLLFAIETQGHKSAKYWKYADTSYNLPVKCV